MSHMIDLTVNAAGSAVYANRPAWHGYGTVLNHAPSAAEAIVAAGLDWKVSKRAAYFVGPDGGMVRVPGLAFTVREDSEAALGTVGEKTFDVLQNIEAFDAVDEVLREEGIVYESAGSLDGGRRVWLLARNPEASLTAGGDKVDPYFLIYNGHDGKTRLTMAYTGVRVVCQNTVNAALAGNKSAVRITHTASMRGRISEARKAFERIGAAQAAFAAKADRLATMRMSERQVSEAVRLSLDLVLGPEEMPAVDRDASLIGQIIEAHDAQPSLRKRTRAAALDTVFNLTKRELADAGTDVVNAWLLSNAITEWADLRPSFRGSEAKAAERRFDELAFGSVAADRRQIFQIVEKVAAA